MHPPRSIFTGISSTPESAHPESRRPSTPAIYEPLHRGAEAAKPPTPREHKPSAPSSLEAPWTTNPPADPSKPRRSSVSATANRSEAPRAADAARTPPAAVAGKKRSGVHDDAAVPPRQVSSEPLHKRRRVNRSRHSLDLFSLGRSAQLKDGGQPPSPLFFSHSRRTRPHLPARFSSSEAAARMLSKTRNEDSGIKTVALARGTFSGLSPPGPTSATSGRNSERSSLPPTTSPDARDRSDPLRLLGSVGIVELLEQDNRPTFIVDTGDGSSHAPAATGLQIVFANSALRASPQTWDLVVGKLSHQAGDDPAAHASTQFRDWLLSTVIEGESLDVNPPPVEHGGIIWSCYTLRKRLRVVSGAVPSPTASSIQSTSASNKFGVSSPSGFTPSTGRVPSVTSALEPQDYFGSTVPITLEASDQDPMPEPRSNSSYDLPESDDVTSHPFQKPGKLDLPPLEGLSSFTNECVLRAHAAGDIDPFHREQSPTQEPDIGFFDWTRLSMSPSLPRHIQFARSVDWASTPLGAIEYWSNDLRAMCNLIMLVCTH